MAHPCAGHFFLLQRSEHSDHFICENIVDKELAFGWIESYENIGIFLREFQYLALALSHEFPQAFLLRSVLLAQPEH